jgi:Raf kinase inhibitor-like YbhB/YbcL family protein
LKPQRPHNTNQHYERDCSTPANAALAECIIQDLETKIKNAAIRGNLTLANETAVATPEPVAPQLAETTAESKPQALRRMTQSLVSQKMQLFKKSVDAWSCEEEYKRHVGVRVVNGETDQCAMRVRVTDSLCETPFFPQQFVCQQNFTGPRAVANQIINGPHSMSPSLIWKDFENETQSFVVLVEDSSPPPFISDYEKVYWLVTDIPASVTSIDGGASGHDGVMPPLSVEQKNSFGFAGYTAPCPGPHEVREYRMRVFAMPHTNTKLFLSPSYRSTSVIQQLQKQALCMSTIELPFTYKIASFTQTSHAHTATVAPSTPSDVPGELTAPN